MEEIIDPCHPGDRCLLASGRVSAVLALDLAHTRGGWKKANQQGSARPDLPHGCRESNVGSATHPRELLKLGFVISERTVSRWVRRANHDPDPARRWLAFLRNHREAIAAWTFSPYQR